MSTRLFQFNGDVLSPVEWCDPLRGSVLVADSWRVEEGHAVALGQHFERFFASAKAHSPLSQDTLDQFARQVCAAIEKDGSWFPRIELVTTPGGPTLRYRQRPAPAWSQSVIAALTTEDPRTTPLTKGPDLEALLALRNSVSSSGANEALIVNADGVIVEGAYSSLLVWNTDTEVLVTPRSFPRIPSVTETVLRECCAEEGVQITERAVTASDLEGREVWVVSALHGIRLVEALVQGPQVSSSPGRRDSWQERWWSRRLPITWVSA